MDKFDKQEMKDRYVAERCLEYLLKKGTNLDITSTPTSCPVDLKCKIDNTSGKTLPFNVEIKERKRTPSELEKYPLAELKEAKLHRMIAETPNGTHLYYMVLLNEEKCMLFDLKNLDWSKVNRVIWNIKVTQLDPNSPVIPTPTYMIPYDMARVTCDCSNYYKEYYALHQ